MLHHLFFCIKAFAFVSSSSSASSLCSINPSKRAIHENKYTFFLRLHILFNNTLLCGDEEEACYILLSFLNLMQYTFFETQFTQLLKTLLFLWKTFLENNKLNYLSHSKSFPRSNAWNIFIPLILELTIAFETALCWNNWSSQNITIWFEWLFAH